MTDDEIKAKFSETVKEHLEVDDSKIHEDAEFYQDLGADSLDMLELTMVFEEEFNIEIPDKDVEKLKTVGSALTYLYDRVK